MPGLSTLKHFDPGVRVVDDDTSTGVSPRDGGDREPSADTREEHRLARVNPNVPRRYDYTDWHCGGSQNKASLLHITQTNK